MGFSQERRAKYFPAAAKPCDMCHSAAALLFCRADAAFLCITCDATTHSNKAHAHARVWMCEVCEQAPSAVTCKADAAALCHACDRDIHSANPLARRHERAVVVPFYDTAESMVVKGTVLVPDLPVDTTDSWISSTSSMVDSEKFTCENHEVKPADFLFSDSDQFLDFDGYRVGSQPYSDSVVPVQATAKAQFPAQLADYSPENRIEIDFNRPNMKSFSNSYNTQSLSVSSSSMDVGVVPDGSSLSEISYPFARNVSSSVDLTRGQGSQVVGMDREARVLRYKEKRKNRKFEKTIRYASRKAYAETRPRIKGRFAKRTEAESDIDQYFSSGSINLVPDARYGVVPSF